MIKIDTDEIENWNAIKTNHYNWGENLLKNKLEELYSIKTGLEKEFYKIILRELEIILIEKIPRELIGNLKEIYNEINKNDEANEFLKEIEVFNKKQHGPISNKKTIEDENIDETINRVNRFFSNAEFERNEVLRGIKNSYEIKKKDTKTKRNRIRIDLKKALEKYYNDNSPFKDQIVKLFDYEKFAREKRHEVISMMNVRVCPYCQRNYITNYIGSEESNKTTADLDHFYCQEKYPFLALSLYNFIPSCQICNSRLKGSVSAYEEKLLYPYEESFEDSRFKAVFKTDKKLLEEILSGNAEFRVELNIEDYLDEESRQRVQKTIETFCLNEIYSTSHNNYIKSLIENLEEYPEGKYIEISEIFGEEIDEIKIKSELREIVEKPYKDRIEAGEPLAKLTKDILEELEIELRKGND